MPDRMNCNSCGREVNVDSGGYLANHSRPSTKVRCDGSGRHRSFVKGK